MGPFAEWYYDDCPLCQYGEVEEEEPEVAGKQIQVNEESHCKGGDTHQEEPDNEKPVR